MINFDAAMQLAVLAMSDADRKLMIEHGVREIDLPLIGRVTARVLPSGLYVPDPAGAVGYVTPVRQIYSDTPEARWPDHAVRYGQRITDLVLWHPIRPNDWALRLGRATWLGAVEPQYCDPAPVPIRRSVLSWFRHGCTGLVPLSSAVRDQYQLVTIARDTVVADDAEHRAELQRVLLWTAPRILIGTRNGS